MQTYTSHPVLTANRAASVAAAMGRPGFTLGLGPSHTPAIEGAFGLSYEEAADKQNVPIGTIKSRVQRARACLAAMLDADEPIVPRFRRGGTRAYEAEISLSVRATPWTVKDAADNGTFPVSPPLRNHLAVG